MKSSKRNINVLSTFIPPLATLLGIVAIYYLCFWLGIKKPYNDFKQREQDIISQLDALNLTVAQQLPALPSETFYLERSSRGSVTSIHGRWLYIDAKTTLDVYQIQKYYQTFFLSNGWTVNPDYDNTYFYKTSCIEIWFLGPPSQEFSIIIWHDFKKQSFTPREPNVVSMSFYEYGETIFAKCP